MKSIITLAGCLFSLTMYAQVGINNNNPQATLDITAKTTNGSRPEGLIAPRLTGDQIRAGDAQYGTAQKGAIIYATAAATSVSSKTANITSEGYYYFDGTAWQKITGGASAGDTTNDAWVNDTANSMVKLGTKADGTARTTGTDFVAKDDGSVGIGTASPDASAALEVNSSSKGMLIPRVALAGSTDVTTIPSPATGLMAYNTGTGALTYKGFVFWNGTEWRAIDNNSTISPAITSLNCTDSSVFPRTFTSGVPYSGTLTVPYSGGNGGSYTAGTSFTQNGLTFTLNAGTLNYGNGSISYSISGTPNFTSPNTVSVPVSFLGNTCNAAIGSNNVVSSLSYVKNTVTIDANTPTTSVTTIGNISVRYNGTGLVAVPQIRINGFSDRASVWMQKAGTGSNLDPSFILLDCTADTWNDFPSNFNPGNRDSATTLISLFGRNEIYRVSFVGYPSFAASGSFPAITSSITIFIEKLQ
ncbi:hypothetical protein QF023_002575 [Chryseobacterium sp. SLBN-27]|uniref:hypothetical protein n=1 Tax=Chryseobacterium sp. SLBN-27 TaxID=3042287 RepID=UPI00285C5A91|nr:hypothetical protein [Chryseobacterium sp. SLBN-27]MDR6159059.1 hypothetical protein [Chryseobacterium sp. SLBN-27]